MSAANRVVCMAWLLTGLALGATGAFLWQRGSAAKPPAEELPRSWEATVYLPLHDNQGKPFRQATWDAAVAILVKQFGGATLGAQRRGLWLDGHKRIQSEPMQLCTVSFARERLEEFRQTIREVGRHLGQQSIYARLAGPRILLLDIPPSEQQKGQ